MKHTIIRYGTYSAITLCSLALVGWFIGKNFDYTIQEAIGYTTMVVSLVFIYFGIRYYRDHENKGIVSFGTALWIGVVISLIAGLSFGILDVIYIKYIHPDFVTEYYMHHVDTLRNTLSEAEFQIELEKLESQKELFSNTFFNFFLMFATVLIIGFIVSLISAVILQRKQN
ncbi:DUF4199 domain-containing protein [Aquimarina sp. U1-2]|uniref:DUF4199 domain-containing protein n=1 Tax=Aquimarina sp. U1-2 TaxID=2823141 RepID=UPI001AECC4C5|nr:DUF4199 domain-containing protein [Aquimarina sp. U1-2]MBP2833193.1 DUF4199 domain-containing protein [Aquimarina sp. U1-2]